MFVQVTRATLGYRKTGSVRTEMYEPGEYLEIRDEDAPRLIEMKAVKIVDKETYLAATERASCAPATTIPGEHPTQGEKAPETPKNGEKTVSLESMSYNELKAKAKALGIETGKLKSKSSMIAAIEGAMNAAPADYDLPELTPQDVVDA